MDPLYFTNHTYTITTSLIGPSNHPNHCSRGQGGLIALSNNPQNFQVIQTTEYTISLKFQNLVISAVYFPPSLKLPTISQILTNLPVSNIILGDINVRYGVRFKDICTNPSRRQLLENFFSANGFCHSIPTNLHTKTDHLFHSSNLRVDWELVADNSFKSDHLLMKVELPDVISNPRRAQSTRFNLKNLEDPRKVDLLKNSLNHKLKTTKIDHLLEMGPSLNPTEAQQQIDKVYNLLTDHISKCCSSTLGTYIPKFKTKTNEAANLRSLKKENCNNRSNKVIDNEQTVEQHFINQFQSIPKPQKLQYPIPQLPHYVRLYFSSEAIIRFFKHYPKQKACGIDGLHTRIIEVLLETDMKIWLSNLFHKCIQTGTTPTRWNESLTFPIAKSTESIHIADFRPVALTNMFRRCFEALFLNMIQAEDDFLQMRTLNFAQAGFQKHRSCPLLILAGQENFTRGFTESIFIDLKSAYDRVNQQLLMDDLKKRGTPNFALSLIQSMFFSCSTRVALNDSATGPIELHTGLFQGSILAPLLWNIYIDDLATALNGSEPNSTPIALFFADDIRLQLKRNTDPFTTQLYLDRISNWSRHKNMMVNIKKCGIIGRHINLYLENQLIPIVNTYKYLGMEHGKESNIDFDIYYDRILNKATSFLSFLVTQQAHPDLKVAATKQLLIPRLEYGLPLYLAAIQTKTTSNKHLASIQTILNQAVAWIFNKDDITNTMFSMSGIPMLSDRVQMLAASFTNHIEQAPAHSVIAQIHKQYVLPPSNSILCSFFRNPLYLEHKRLAEPKCSLMRYLQKWKLDQLQNYGQLARYIQPAGRSPGGMDRVLQIPNPIHRYIAIQFRLNKLFHQATCNTCLGGFTRRCLEHPTDTILPTPEPLLKIRTHLPNYHYLDFLLDNGLHDGFLEQLAKLATLKSSLNS